ncbi:Ig-like domain-containing domain [Algoriphagus marinus]|uniref:Ig-like domain-containing domain n=1 Tax=Algoriphagus marinus TaxID=1925762 RepID=UPI00094BAE47|nr:Ig-like domain-containing domain [Algoriphagus marinus]
MRYLPLFILILLISSCAKQSTPLGGPRDEDPPVLLELIPKNESLNIKPEKITLVFDEYIKLDNANKNIIITPRINKDELIISALKNSVIIELNQELEDSTTYVFNFQKSIQDLSEGNSAENLKLVFSTGTTIDSLTFSGKTNIYFPDPRAPYEDIIVGLYPSNDTTDVFTAPPYYLTQADSIGNFKITNIKSGDYRAYAWKDDNNSLKAEFKSESFDFLPDTITIDQNIEDINFNLSKGDQTPIRILRSSTNARGYDIIYNKTPVEISIESAGLGQKIFYTEGDKRIKLYAKEALADSIATKISLKDSVGNRTDSLIYAKFEESERRKDELTISPNSGKSFYRELAMELTFNKPLQSILYDSLYLSYDTASVIQIIPTMISFIDSMRMDKMRINMTIPDSIPMQIFTLNAKDSTFLDIEGVYNEKELKANYKKLRLEELADEISGSIDGAEGPFIVQLINKNEIKREEFINNGNTFSFRLVEAGIYQIRVIADSNGNKRWDPANFSENRLAEQVFYFLDEENSQDITIRAGWTVPDQIIKASPKTGKN